MLIAHSEGGVFSNPNDTDLWKPLPEAPEHGGGPAPGGKGAAGMLQGAARWSKLARLHCPQIAGVIIDDFWSNYHADPIPPPLPAGQCPACPDDQPHGYGSPTAGFYCCTWPSNGHCDRPPGASGKGPPCCLFPGASEGCQNAKRCGVNAKNNTPCAMRSDQVTIPTAAPLHLHS